MPKTLGRPATDRYLELVRRFPLRRLANAAEHREAVKVLTHVSLSSQGARDSGILDYLDVLAGLIDEYERDARLKMDTSRRSPAEVIRHLMTANQLSVSRLAKETGIGQSNLSEMLSGRRDFSKTAIAKLSDRFGISPAIFFWPAMPSRLRRV